MRRYLLILTILFVLISCVSKTDKPISLKISKTDLFQKTIVKSQYFEINTKKDTVIVGKRGTKIVIPKEAFLDVKDNIVTQNITFELSEALSLEEMILSNLTTTSNNTLLETDGMIFINATYKNHNLKVNKAAPLYIEIPTKDKKNNMMVYKGERDSLGNMNWINPKKLKSYLIPVDLELLDFLPKGFETAAINYLSYFKKEINKKAIDSLYYNLPKNKCDKTLKITVGRWTIIDKKLGVNPPSIKTIKHKKFNNTLIATREFEERLKYIYEICSDTILDYYINNLHKNMWEIDSLMVQSLMEKEPIIQFRTVSESINSDDLLVSRELRKVDTIGYKFPELKKKFIEFQNQKLTNVEHKSIYINQLKSFYEIKLRENIKKADSLYKIAIIKEKNAKIKIAYRKILKEREKITMQSYGFKQTEMGWINIDKGVVSKDWNYQQIDVFVKNEVHFEQVHTYLVFSKTKSIVKLKSVNEKQFELNSSEERIPITKNSKIKAVVVGLIGEQYYYGMQGFISKKEVGKNTISINLVKSNMKSIKDKLNKMEAYDESNDIAKDLKLSIEIKKEEKLKEDLLKAAFPCCI